MSKKVTTAPPCAKPAEGSRRTKAQKEDAELYKISNIQSFIEQERRHDELSRLQEVQQQNAVWVRTVVICAFFNVILVSLAVWGIYK